MARRYDGFDPTVFENDRGLYAATLALRFARLVVIVPLQRTRRARTKTGSQATSGHNLPPRRSDASAGRQTGPGDPALAENLIRAAHATCWYS